MINGKLATVNGKIVLVAGAALRQQATDIIQSELKHMRRRQCSGLEPPGVIKKRLRLEVINSYGE